MTSTTVKAMQELFVVIILDSDVCMTTVGKLTAQLETLRRIRKLI